jgi:uncharacterized repeat protein (TIGR01451 family)
MACGLLGSGALAQDKGAAPPPPVAVHAMPDLPPLPEPSSAPAPPPTPAAPGAFPAPIKTDSQPGSFPAPLKADSQPVSPTVPASPDPLSNFATLPRSNETPPGRPPAFRLLATPPHAQNTSHYTMPAEEHHVEIPVVTATPALTLEKNGPSAITLGQPLVYELVVRNIGAVAAQQVRVDDALPPGTRFLAAEPETQMQAERLSWIVDNLPPGSERHFKVRVQPTTAGDWRGNACASTVVSVTSSLRTQVMASGQMAAQPMATQPARPEMRNAPAAGTLTIALAGPQTVAVGQPAVFQIRITNNGTQTLRGLVLRDRVPAGLQHTAGPELEADLGILEPGKTRNITLTTNAVQPGRFVNEAMIASTDGQNAQARAAIQIMPAARPH